MFGLAFPLPQVELGGRDRLFERKLQHDGVLALEWWRAEVRWLFVCDSRVGSPLDRPSRSHAGVPSPNAPPCTAPGTVCVFSNYNGGEDKASWMTNGRVSDVQDYPQAFICEAEFSCSPGHACIGQSRVSDAQQLPTVPGSFGGAQAVGWDGWVGAAQPQPSRFPPPNALSPHPLPVPR
jgi:hypothetical protein